MIYHYSVIHLLTLLGIVCTNIYTSRQYAVRKFRLEGGYKDTLYKPNINLSKSLSPEAIFFNVQSHYYGHPILC